MGGKARQPDTEPKGKRRGGGHPRPIRPAAPRGRWWRRLFLVLVFAVLVSLGVTIARRIPITHRFYTDAEAIREPAGAAQTRDILWQPPKRLVESTGTAVDGYEPRLSADGLTMFFVRGKAGDNADIFVSIRKPVTSEPRASARATLQEQSLLSLALHPNRWSDPKPLAAVNSDYDDLGPEPSPDGRSVYFYSDRPGGSGGYDLWVAHRSDSGWQEPTNLGPSVNSEFNDYRPALTPNGQTLYFSSNRPEPRASARADARNSESQPEERNENARRRNYDLYRAVVTDRGVEEATPVTLLNTPYNDGAPAISAFGDFLYFVSDRPGGEGGYDLYRSRRVHGRHLPAENVGAAVNTRFDELDPTLGLGGYTLYFSSDRFPQRPESRAEPVATSQESAQEHKYDLYYTTSREVFSELERTYRPAIDWAALWSKIAPNLLWALFALLLTLALLALMRDAHGRRLSLIAKCLLASLTAHVVLLLIFNVWQVTTTLAHELRRRGPVRVALNSTSTSDALAGQIRGRLTNVANPAPPAISTPRQEAPVEVQAVAAMATLTVDRYRSKTPDESTVDVSSDDATVVQRTERPRPTEPLADALTPMRFEAALPTGPQRIEAAEIHSAAPPNRELHPTESRPSTDNIRLPSHAATVEVAPSPSTHDTSTIAMARSSMSDALPVREATTQAPMPFASQADRSTARSDRPPTPALALSGMPAQRLPEIDEKTSHVAGETTPPHRAVGFSPRVQDTPDDASALTVRIGPTIIGAPPGDSTLAETPTTHDTPPNSSFASTDAPTTLAQDFSQLPLAELSVSAPLPSSPALLTDGTPQDESQPIGSLATAVARRSLPTDAAVAQSGETPRPFEPGPIASRPDQHSLAPTPQPEVTATTQRRDGREDLLATEVNAALPELVDIALPSLEQYVLALQTELKPQATAMAASLPRASLTGSLSHGETLPLSTTLEVRASPRAESDEPFADAPDSAGDFDAERSDLLAALAAPTAPDLSIPELDTPKLSLPTEEEQPTSPYDRRRAPDRMEIVEQGGGSEETERAVADALRWLARHQSEDGRWDGDGFDERCGRCGGETNIVVDHALTGLALLAFLGAGHTHVDDGAYQRNVERGLQWLLGRQAADGDLRGDETMYSHAIATIALSEAYGMTGERRLADPVQRAILFIDRARNVRVGGWRYDPGQAGDTSVLGWQVMALKSASMNRIPVPAGSFKAARTWLDLVCSRSPRGLYAYRPGRPHTPAMTAESMFTQQLLGLPREDPRMQVSSEYISQHAPDWESQVNTYFWYYATLALFQHQGSRWLEWNERLTDQLLTHQRRDGKAAGSWDPEGEWADIGGRIYQTTLCTLMLEVYYRYLPLYSLEQTPVDLVGAIRGLVTDATTGLAIPGATVRLDMPDRSLVSAQTARDGSYLLLAPEVPDHFALSAFAEGYVPSSANVASAEVKGTTLTLDFELDPQSRELVAIESTPGVHHLGDDNFDGRINSQFQKKSEGSVYAASFDLQETQVRPHVRSAEVRLLAKGVQRSHKIRINGTVLEDRLDDAPPDGSFGEFVASFDPSLLAAGTNTFEIIAKPSRTDIDDFEFVNVRIWLQP